MKEREFTSNGFMTVSNGNRGIGELYFAVEAAVKAKLQHQWETVFPGHPVYDMASFNYNLKCINEDMDAGRIPEAATWQEWVDAMTNEYTANFEHGFLAKFFPKDGQQRTKGIVT